MQHAPAGDGQVDIGWCQLDGTHAAPCALAGDDRRTGTSEWLEHDVAFVGIGENGHLAFNDPPADFDTEAPYIVVNLDEACRRQQVGEGWFAGMEDVPTQAISMSVRQILKAKEIICIAPDARKAVAVRNCFETEISPMVPASALRTHLNTTIYLDTESSSLLTKPTSGN